MKWGMWTIRSHGQFGLQRPQFGVFVFFLSLLLPRSIGNRSGNRWQGRLWRTVRTDQPLVQSLLLQLVQLVFQLVLSRNHNVSMCIRGKGAEK